ncbi:MAG TPA: SRPBCC domain-containing protein [Ilumatobacteraceae bacterium]|nr:SRPBCC domain-containing protein [Ilumatobacteraceae bacterium]
MSPVTASASIVVDRPREQVWRALTDPDLVSQYFMGATVKTDWEVGHPITFTGVWKDKPYEDKGEVLEFKPEEELSYSHWSPLSGADDTPENYHVVRLALDDATGGGTKVTLEQSNLTGGVTEADRKSRADYEKNWSATLKGLKQVAEG